MPMGRPESKPPGKSPQQLLFSKAVRHKKVPPAEKHQSPSHTSMADTTKGVTMDLILQEISAISRKLESMDSAMTSLTAETKSMRLDIAGFQAQVSRLDQRVTTVESQVASWGDGDQELLHLRNKLIDLEDRATGTIFASLGSRKTSKGRTYTPTYVRLYPNSLI
ncbi:hypothetical protein NDU88_007360 [Pleurodeles waltl]|uniref:Uncharacterized protein n=1 Tax=Pleurodeles waltl TaxID=8319 RepID=A0AAV7N547_PLEWA|nr:hypothetical protein NDU88_007360 [Pleurodeles waltl]